MFLSFVCKQKTAYEMLISDWSSDVCSSDLVAPAARSEHGGPLDERLDVRLQRVDVLAEHRLADLRDEALVGDVDLLDLHLARLGVEKVVALCLRELADRLVGRNLGLVRRVHPTVRGVHGPPSGAPLARISTTDDRAEVEDGDEG